MLRIFPESDLSLFHKQQCGGQAGQGQGQLGQRPPTACVVDSEGQVLSLLTV